MTASTLGAAHVGHMTLMVFNLRGVEVPSENDEPFTIKYHQCLHLSHTAGNAERNDSDNGNNERRNGREATIGSRNEDEKGNRKGNGGEDEEDDEVGNEKGG
ncbi:hypothetical protein HOY80DRAFT_1055066 [Tuber brumale]|nr:hypothetical protein HOY80DRAFT_1055066 [Tuber brumale]